MVGKLLILYSKMSTRLVIAGQCPGALSKFWRDKSLEQSFEEISLEHSFETREVSPNNLGKKNPDAALTRETGAIYYCL